MVDNIVVLLLSGLLISDIIVELLLRTNNRGNYNYNDYNNSISTAILTLRTTIIVVGT